MIRSKTIVLSLILLGSCGQDYNSNSGDEHLAPPVAKAPGECEAPGDARRCAAIAVIQTKCLSCHAEWKNYKSDKDWTGSKLVSPGDLDSSKLISATINAGGTMPLGGSALPNADYQALTDWVAQMVIQ